ncbi:protein of unknown function [Magnetospirillum sp. XM-1]|nr:protein of unknown function [Magnetospirillum sp. XM-1]
MAADLVQKVLDAQLAVVAKQPMHGLAQSGLAEQLLLSGRRIGDGVGIHEQCGAGREGLAMLAIIGSLGQAQGNALGVQEAVVLAPHDHRGGGAGRRPFDLAGLGVDGAQEHGGELPTAQQGFQRAAEHGEGLGRLPPGVPMVRDQGVQAKDVQGRADAVAGEVETVEAHARAAAIQAAPEVAADARRRLEKGFHLDAERRQPLVQALGPGQQVELHGAGGVDLLDQMALLLGDALQQRLAFQLAGHAGDGVADGAAHRPFGVVALDQVILGAGLQGVGGETRVVQAGHDDDGRPGGGLLHARDRGDAGGIGQAEIQQDHVHRLVAAHMGDGGRQGGHVLDHEGGGARHPERIFHQTGVAGLVLHQEDVQDVLHHPRGAGSGYGPRLSALGIGSPAAGSAGQADQSPSPARHVHGPAPRTPWYDLSARLMDVCVEHCCVLSTQCKWICKHP